MTADAADLNYGSIRALSERPARAQDICPRSCSNTRSRASRRWMGGSTRSSFAISTARERRARRRCRAWSRRAAAIARHTRDLERALQRRGPADQVGLSAFQGFPAGGGCPGRLAIEGGRRRHHRQDQHPDRACGISRATTRSMGRRTTTWDLGRSPGGSSADRARRWPQASVHSPSARISAARSGCPRISAACSDTSRASAWSRCADIACRRLSPVPGQGDLAVLGRWRAPPRPCAGARRDCRPGRDARRRRLPPRAAGPAPRPAPGFQGPRGRYAIH